MKYNSTILPPPAGRECNHPCCSSVCRKKKVEQNRATIKKSAPKSANAELERWFEDRRREMKGFCQNCSAKSCKGDNKWYKASIAHLLPKRLFKSVATHPLNWLELCFWGENSCHTQMDNSMLDLIDMHCFDTIIERFVAIYPSIDQKERRYIPEVLLQYLNTDT